MGSYDQPRQHIKKQRYYFVNKGPPSQGYGFSSGHLWMWELDYKESWVLKNWCFELWCWRRLLRVPWNARRSNQSTLKEISPEYSLEGVMLKLKLPILWPPDAIQPSHPLSNPSPPAFNLSQHQGLFQWMSQFFTSGSQSIAVSSSASDLSMNI